MELGIIYLLTDKNKKCYVGQTKNINNRIPTHIMNIKNKSGCSSHLLDIDFICETLEDNITDCNLTLREQYWYDLYREKCGNLLVNVCRPLNKPKDYYQQHKDEIIERNKEYYQQNAEERRKYQNHYRQQHIDEVKEINKAYRQQHTEEIREINKAYRQQHIDEIKEKRKKYTQQKYNCECGTIISLDSKKRHFKSQKHINYLSTTTPTGFA